MPATNKNKRDRRTEETMLAFQLIGLAFAALFFGAMVTGKQSFGR
jgi:hypothetical protein